VTSLLDRLLSRSNPPAYSEADYTGARYVGVYDTMGKEGREDSNAAMVSAARATYKQNGVVFACQLVRNHLFSEIRFCYQALTDLHLFGDQSLRLLEHPWPNADTGELLARMQQDGSLGNCYLRKVNPAEGGDPLLLQMRQEHVVIMSLEKRDDLDRPYKIPVGYAEIKPGGESDPQIYTTDEICHFSPEPDPDARWRGMSWLTPLLGEARADLALTRYRQFHLDNGAMPGLVVKYATKLSDLTIDTLRKRLRARYGGPENAGNVLVLDQGADLTVAGSSLEQLQFQALAQVGERRIAAAAGPGMAEIIGLEAGGGDYQSAIRKLADLWARPQWRIACASLEHLLPPSAASNPQAPVRLWYDVAGVAALREGELQRSQSFLVTMQGIASAVAAGYSRDSAVKAADAGDVSLLQADPKAPPPGGGATQPSSNAPGQEKAPTGGPTGGLGNGMRPPQAYRPEQLTGVGKPNVPNARPGSQRRGVPALAGGARGSNGKARRAELNGHGQDDEQEAPPWWQGWQG
jgi:phage portal protein BeeE